MNPVKPKLEQALASNDEDLDDVIVLYGEDHNGDRVSIDLAESRRVSAGRRSKIADLDYIDGERFGRFAQHVAYTDDHVYISAPARGYEPEQKFVSTARSR